MVRSHGVTAALHGACWLAVVGAAGCLSLQLAGDRVGRYLTPAQALTLWVVPFAGLAALVAASIGRHVAATGGALVMLAFLGLTAPLAFPPALPAPAPSATALTITHANLLYSNPTLDATIAALLASDADVLAVSELTPQFAAAIDASEIGERYPHRLLRPGDAAIGLGIWSRVPLQPGPRTVDGQMNLAVDVVLDDRPMTIVLAHPLPPLNSGIHWRREIEALAARPDGERARTVVVADLNVSYVHPPFRRFLDETGYTDVHQALGHGFSVSWPTDEVVPPFVRLDHALVGREVTATDLRDFDLPGSDHRAFTVTVSWAQR